jgi:hypothetical protein
LVHCRSILEAAVLGEAADVPTSAVLIITMLYIYIYVHDVPRQLSWGVSADAGFVHGKSALLGDMIKETLCSMCQCRHYIIQCGAEC